MKQKRKLSKKLLAIASSLAITITMLPQLSIASFAADEPIDFATNPDSAITTLNGGDATKASWDAGTKTLTLSGVNCSMAADYKNLMLLPDGTTIVVADGTENFIEKTDDRFSGICGLGDVTIKGKGKLTIKGGDSSIDVKGTGSLSVTDTTLVCSAINVAKDFTFTTSSITARDTDDAAVTCNGTLNAVSGSLNAYSNAKPAIMSKAFNISDGITVSGCTTVDGELETVTKQTENIEISFGYNVTYDIYKVGSENAKHVKLTSLKSVTFNTGVGAFEDESTSASADIIGGTVTAPEDPTADYNGMEFGGWYTDEACTTAFTNSGLTDDMTVYAKWTVGGKLVTVGTLDFTAMDTTDNETYGWNWNKDTKTLILTNATIINKTGSGNAIKMPADGIIILTADTNNTVLTTASMSSIYCEGTLTIKGSTAGTTSGSLTATSISAGASGNLNITDCYVDVDNDVNYAAPAISAADGALTITNSAVSAKTKTGNSAICWNEASTFAGFRIRCSKTYDGAAVNTPAENPDKEFKYENEKVKFVTIDNKREIKFSAQSDNGSSNALTDNNGVVTLPETDPINDDLTFGGWYTEPDGTGTKLENGSVIAESCTVYAKWTDGDKIVRTPVLDLTSTETNYYTGTEKKTADATTTSIDASYEGWKWTYVGSFTNTQAVSETNCTGILELTDFRMYNPETRINSGSSEECYSSLKLPAGTLVKVNGICYIKTKSCELIKKTVDCAGNIAFVGTGSLDIISNSYEGGKALCAVGSMVIDGPTLNVENYGSVSIIQGIVVEKGTAAAEALIIKSGKVSAKVPRGGAEGNHGAAIVAEGDNGGILISGGEVNVVEVGATDSWAIGIWGIGNNGKGVSITGGTVKVNYCELTAANNTAETASGISGSGSVGVSITGGTVVIDESLANTSYASQSFGISADVLEISANAVIKVRGATKAIKADNLSAVVWTNLLGNEEFNPTTANTALSLGNGDAVLTGTSTVARSINYSQFVPVTDITGLPAAMGVTDSVNVCGTAVPDDATNKTVTWLLNNDPDTEATGAAINDGVLTVTAEGTITLTAIVANGKTDGNFEKVFTIVVSANPTFTVTYNKNAIGPGNPYTSSVGEAASECTFVSSNVLYTFKHWNTKSDDTGTSYNPGDIITSDSDVTLYAIWGNDSEPSAVVADVTIDGTINERITEKTITITLTNDTLSRNARANDFVQWITNAPDGIQVQIAEAAETGAATIKLKINGISAAAISAPLAITIPAGYLTSNADLTVMANANAKWAIVDPSAKSIFYLRVGGDGSMNASRTGEPLSACTFTAPEGKVFKNWNTNSDGTGTSYNPGDVIATASVTAEELVLYAIWGDEATDAIIEVINGVGGMVSPNGTVTVADGGSQTFTMTPAAGWKVKDIIINGRSTGSTLTEYTLSALHGNMTFEVQFEEIGGDDTYTVRATANAGGTITPSGDVVVNAGETKEFAIAANDGYTLENVILDSVTIGASSLVKLENITENHTIIAAFSLNNPDPLPPAHTHFYTQSTYPATCTSDGYTDYVCICGDHFTGNTVPATGHNWGDWTVTTAATVDADGVETRVCANCGATETRAIPKLEAEEEPEEIEEPEPVEEPEEEPIAEPEVIPEEPAPAGKWIEDDNGTPVFVFENVNGDMEVYVDGELVDPMYYTVNEDGTITFTPEFIAMLGAGEHEFKVLSSAGEITTTFVVEAEKTENPATGVALPLMGIAFAAIAMAIGKKRK